MYSDLPDHRYQVFQKTLLEHEYHHEDAFVSASLSRLHHGVYDLDKLNLDGPQPYNVTFVAITFVFHPMHSVERRFKRAQISIQAFKTTGEKVTDQPLRIIKFAPHIAFGRYSTENLHWNFSLGAILGVSLPTTAAVTPSTEYDKSKVIGSTLKIQGSTRSAKGIESSKLVWSLEENEQQATGLPREFTFVFLIEQPVAKAPFALEIGIKPVFSHSVETSIFGDEISQKSDILSDEVGQTFSSSPHAFNFATMLGSFEHLVELPGSASTIQDYVATESGIHINIPESSE
ncbi:b07b42c4-0e40-480b-92e0-0b28b160ac63 [Sclerotinia trifoliorum]|uniref:B07b42c4-0e40-480b-92e0-0b28b160ac63 n=1 Tax=Sclerotinia trifoliorum TaxID=28548 RepID=A0A8H2VLM3_9HELO|nr:b07b42c4-0e40-480b-92e0-0b28b160ac63 [Sclerotinia trifoliorum]